MICVQGASFTVQNSSFDRIWVRSKNSIESVTRPEWLTCIVATATLLVATYVPFAVEERSRQVQNQGNCTQALFSLRKELASYFSLSDNEDGTIKESDGDTSAEEKARNYSIRVDLQSARDSVYAACVDICDNEQVKVVDADSDPWIGSPTALKERWPRTNLDELLRVTSTSIDKISSISAGSYLNPWNWVNTDPCTR